MNVPDATDFAEFMATGDPPLDRTLAAIAAFERRDVEPEQLLHQLDEIASNRLADNAVDLCSELFSSPGGFTGNRSNYYDPANSLLDMVLQRRLGIPITLAVVAIEVGRRRGIGLLGIGMPGHFLLRDAADPETFIDPFDPGRLLDVEGCRRRFEQLHGTGLEFDPAHLSPAPQATIVLRVLNNLHEAYRRAGDRRGVLRAVSLRAAAPGAPLAVRHHLAELVAADGGFDEAAGMHERLALEDPARSETHLAAARRLRARLN